MGSRVEWFFKMVDQASEPASIAEKKLALLEERLKRLDKVMAESKDPKVLSRLALSKMDLEIKKDEALLGKADKSTGAWIWKLNQGLGIVTTIGGAALKIGEAFEHAAEKVGELTSEFVKFGFEAASAKEKNVFAFEKMLGKEQGREFVERLEKLTLNTPFSGEAMLGFGRNLLAGGFGEKEVPVLLKALADASTVAGMSEEKFDGAVGALRRINLEGHLTTKTMKALNDAGVPALKVYDYLAREFGVTADAAKKLVKAGKIDATTGIFAIVDTIKATRSGGVLGAAAEEFTGGTAAGLMNRIKKRFEMMFGDLFTGAGFKSGKGFLASLDRSLAGAGGASLSRGIGSAFDAIMGGAFGSGLGSVDQLDRLLRRVGEGIEIAGTAIGSFGRGALEGFAEASGLGKLLDGPFGPEKLRLIGEEAGALGGRVGRLVVQFEKLAEAIIKLMGPLLRFMDVPNGPTAEQAADYAAGQARLGSDLRSGAISEKLSLGDRIKISLGAPGVSGAVGDAGFGARMGMAWGGAPQSHVTVHVDARGASTEAAHEIATKTAEKTRDAVGSAMTNVAWSWGRH